MIFKLISHEEYFSILENRILFKKNNKYSICTYFLEIKNQLIFSNICVSRKYNTFPWVKAVKMLFPVASFPSWSQQMICNYFVKINVIDGTGWEVTYISSSWYILALQKCSFTPLPYEDILSFFQIFVNLEGKK